MKKSLETTALKYNETFFFFFSINRFLVDFFFSIWDI